ncbi:hypothetical protein C8F04DRAFT_1115052 [Mycena alexandri]|uniref:Uncharacterized protein n=1 Tax=Mycena alexandri TaxID=1745969 RepID=A0AAD6SL78_9AGAR|nr:hypothetical protein C8F04DRAFT_1115052 [Mycena alexandri]
MPFFENASNFKISGGTFNVIAGDLNQYENHHSTYTSSSYNEYPDDRPTHQYYDPYAQWSPRGRYPTHSQRRHQHRHQEQGPFGYADYYEDRRSQSESYYDAGYPQPPGRFENSLRSTAHVEIAGGEFNDFPGRDATQRSHRYMNIFCALSSYPPQPDSVPSFSRVDDPIQPENPEPGSESDTSMSEDETSETAPIPAPTPPKPLTTVEKMRMAMADMEIDGTTEIEGTDRPQASPASALSRGDERRQKSSQSFGSKMNPFRQKRSS